MNCVRTRGEEPPRLYWVINGLLRMRNGLRRSQELDDLVDVLASSIGALTNPRTNCPHRRRSRRRSLAARDRRQLPEDRPRTRRGQTRPRRERQAIPEDPPSWPDILRTIELGYSDARLEASDNRIKVTIRMAYGFHHVDNLIALVMLRCGGLDIRLPQPRT